jgi:hypothetical protein
VFRGLRTADGELNLYDIMCLRIARWIGVGSLGQEDENYGSGFGFEKRYISGPIG